MALSRRDLILSGLACFVGWGFLVHWVPLIWYIWYAFIGGAITSLAAFALLILGTARRSQQDGVQRTRPPATMASVAPEAWAEEVAALKGHVRSQYTSLYERSPDVSDELDKMLELMKRDFILPWHAQISRHVFFIDEVDSLLRDTLANLRDRIFEVDLVQAVVARMVPIFTQHLKDFDHAERAVRGKHLERSLTESDELDLAIARKYRQGRLHPAVPLSLGDTERLQQDYLRKTMERVIQQAVPASQIKSHVVFVLIREIVTCMVMLPIIQLLSDPDTWNQLIETYVRYFCSASRCVSYAKTGTNNAARP